MSSFDGKTFPAVKAYQKDAIAKNCCIRNDATRKLTPYLAKNHSEIVSADSNVATKATLFASMREALPHLSVEHQTQDLPRQV